MKSDSTSETAFAPDLPMRKETLRISRKDRVRPNHRLYAQATVPAKCRVDNLECSTSVTANICFPPTPTEHHFTILVVGADMLIATDTESVI